MSGLSVASLGLGRTRQLGALANDRRVYHPLIAIIVLLAACASAPEKQIVSSVTTLPPVQVPVPVRCVKKMPVLPVLQIDPNATVLQRYFQMKAALIEREIYVIDANAALLGCATPPEVPK